MNKEMKFVEELWDEAVDKLIEQGFLKETAEAMIIGLLITVNKHDRRHT